MSQQEKDENPTLESTEKSEEFQKIRKSPCMFIDLETCVVVSSYHNNQIITCQQTQSLFPTNSQVGKIAVTHKQ
jgi:hypothetical protein